MDQLWVTDDADSITYLFPNVASKNQQGNMLSNLRKSNPKRFYRKFKKRKQPVIHDISLEKFEEHFKNLTSKDNTGDLNHDTTETVFDELDRRSTKTN